MNFKEMLETMSLLSEATKEKDGGRVHTADPGGYGRKFDTDQEGEEKKADKKEPAAKRGRGRPKKGSDDSGEVKKYDFSAFGVKSGKDVKLPKYDKSKTTKHTLKDWIEKVDEGEVKLDEKKDKWIKDAIKTPGAFTKKAESHGMSTKEFANKVLSNKEDYPAKTEKQANLAKTLGKIGKKKTDEALMPTDDSTAGAGLGAGRSQTTLEGKGKPDFLDLDKDGNKKESMKKAASDKKKVKEGADHRLKSARHMGKSHALAKEAYNCRYDDMEESRMYHEGYKEGLDECYGKGIYEVQMPATVGGMASQAVAQPAMEDDIEEMDKGDWMKHKAKSTPGDTFKAFGQTFKDKEVLESPFAFEAWDNQLSALLESKEEVTEGMTVSISKGQQGMPDSVSVTAQDAEADQLLGLIKQAGLGLFGGDTASDYGSPHADSMDHGGVKVVGDHDGMMDLIKKVSGSMSDNDYEEEDHGHGEEICEVCHESSCQCDEEMVDEDETMDQREFEVSEEEEISERLPLPAVGPDGQSDPAGVQKVQQAAANKQQQSLELTKQAALAAAKPETLKPSTSSTSNIQPGLAAPTVGGRQMQEVPEDVNNDDEAAEEFSDATRDAALAKAAAGSMPPSDQEKPIDESYANAADDDFTTDTDYIVNTITSGLNGKKSTGQTTIPVVAGQKSRMGHEVSESLGEWKRLAGI